MESCHQDQLENWQVHSKRRQRGNLSNCISFYNFWNRRRIWRSIRYNKWEFSFKKVRRKNLRAQNTYETSTRAS